MSKLAPRVTVVIPSYDGMEHLPECLESLSRQESADFMTLLVDNASRDGSADWVAMHHPEVRVIRLSRNTGFAKAVNEGIAASEGEYVALLNNDTVTDPGWLRGLLHALDTHPDYDFAASKMLLHGDVGRLNAAGDVYSLTGLAGRNRGFGEPARRYTQSQRVLGACAGAAIYRRTVFEDVGSFDEDFFLMSEDTDLNLRCLIAGKRCLYVPDAVVAHKLRASIEKVPAPETRRLASRNEVMTAAKNLPLIVLLCPVPWVCRFLRHTILMRRSNWGRIPTLLLETPLRLRAESEGFRMGWRKRPQVWSFQRAGLLEILRWLVKGYGPVR